MTGGWQGSALLQAPHVFEPGPGSEPQQRLHVPPQQMPVPPPSSAQVPSVVVVVGSAVVVVGSAVVVVGSAVVVVGSAVVVVVGSAVVVVGSAVVVVGSAVVVVGSAVVVVGAAVVVVGAAVVLVGAAVVVVGAAVCLPPLSMCGRRRCGRRSRGGRGCGRGRWPCRGGRARWARSLAVVGVPLQVLLGLFLFDTDGAAIVRIVRRAMADCPLAVPLLFGLHRGGGRGVPELLIFRRSARGHDARRCFFPGSAVTGLPVTGFAIFGLFVFGFLVFRRAVLGCAAPNCLVFVFVLALVLALIPGLGWCGRRGGRFRCCGGRLGRGSGPVGRAWTSAVIGMVLQVRLRCLGADAERLAVVWIARRAMADRDFLVIAAPALGARPAFGAGLALGFLLLFGARPRRPRR